jgi:hypothetical protein
MNFKQSMKKIDKQESFFMTISPKKLNAQHNPSRFKHWKLLHEGPDDKVLNMIYSPHYRLLKSYKEQKYETTPYYKLQKLYGRNDKWIRKKINKFIDMYENIKTNGFKDDPKIVVLINPIVENKYNDSYEIFEGHHRVAICLALNIDCIQIEFKKGQP